MTVWFFFRSYHCIARYFFSPSRIFFPFSFYSSSHFGFLFSFLPFYFLFLVVVLSSIKPYRKNGRLFFFFETSSPTNIDFRPLRLWSPTFIEIQCTLLRYLYAHPLLNSLTSHTSQESSLSRSFFWWNFCERDETRMFDVCPGTFINHFFFPFRVGVGDSRASGTQLFALWRREGANGQARWRKAEPKEK